MGAVKDLMIKMQDEAIANFQLLSEAMDAGLISIVVENQNDSIDGGVIMTDMSDVLDALSKAGEVK